MAKIVLAEDEDSVRNALSKLIALEGHTVICACNGAKAYSIIEDNADIDLLITDIIMPELDGRELIKKICSNRDKFKFPIIMISGFVPFKDIVELLENGVSKFLPKPIESAELIKNINDCLE